MKIYCILNLGGTHKTLTMEYYLCKGENVYINGDKLFISTAPPASFNYFPVLATGYHDVVIDNQILANVTFNTNLLNQTNRKDNRNETELCSHSWKEYIGLTSRDIFCEKCNEIKK